MAKVTLTPAAHPAEPTDATTGLTVLTSTGAGNGFEIAYANAYLVILHNDSGSSATVTLKVNQPTEYSDRGITIPDDTFTLANGESYTWVPQSLFKDSNKNVVVEADQLIKAKAYTNLARA